MRMSYVFRFSVSLFLSFGLLTNIGCKTDGTEDVKNGSFGLSISAVQGDGQTAAPDKLFTQPIMVRVTSDSGKGVKDIVIKFTDTSNSGAHIVTKEVVTDSTGYAETGVRSAAVYNTPTTIQACISASQSCVEFSLSSSSEDSNRRFAITTDNNDIETAGVAFGIQVRTEDLSGNLIEVNETMNLEWEMVSSTSWGGQAPTTMPQFYSCTFVDGICSIPAIVTLTDSRTNTTVFMGDGDGGYIDVSFHQIQVQTGPIASLTITDGPGGPASNAVAVQNLTLNATDAPITFYAANSDIAGNFIEDSATATWSSNKATALTNNFNTTTGPSITYTPNQAIPYPGNGMIDVTDGSFNGSTGLITVDPGDPVDIDVVPKTVDPEGAGGGSPSSLTRTAGYGFEFDLVAKDAKGNRVVRRSFDNGFDGTVNVTFTFANYQNGSMPSGGDIPGFSNSDPVEPRNFQHNVNQSLFLGFNAGRAEAVNRFITFYDGSANPEVQVSVASLSTFAPFSGTTTFTTQIGAPNHINVRTNTGGNGNPGCPTKLDNGNNSITNHDYATLDWDDDDREVCIALILRTDESPKTFYGVVEDRAGNWIADLDNTAGASFMSVNTDPPGTPTGGFVGQISPTFGASFTITPDTITAGDWAGRFIEISGTYLGTPYTTILNGAITPGQLKQLDIAVEYNSTPNPGPYIAAAGARTILIIPKDEDGNRLQNSFVEQIRVTHTGTLTNGPDGTPPVMPPSPSQSNMFFQNHVMYGTGAGGSEAQFTGFTFTNATDSIDITAEVVGSSPLITVTRTIDVEPGSITDWQIWLGGPWPAGENITNTAKTISTDPPYPNLFLNAFDEYENYTNSFNGGDVTWSTPVSFGAGISGMVNNGAQSPFVAESPESGQVRAVWDPPTSGYASINTGLITIRPGDPDHLTVVHPTTMTAGVPEDITVNIVDAKDNVLTDFTGNVDLVFNAFANNPTHAPFDLSETLPANNTYLFSNGTRTFTGGLTFFNATETPYVSVQASNMTTAYGGPFTVTVPTPTTTNINPNSFDHMYARTDLVETDVGTTNDYTIIAEDAYGNRVSSGHPIVNENVTFNITSSLGDEDITASSLGGHSPADLGLANQKTVSGTLSGGQASVTVTSTKAGEMTVNIVPSVSSSIGTDIFEPLQVLPLTTISSVVWDRPDRPATPVSTFSTWLNFDVNVLDSYGNIITQIGDGDNTNDPYGDVATIQLTKSTAGSLTGYSPLNVVEGVAEFTDLQYFKAETFDLDAEWTANTAIEATKSIEVQLGTASQAIVRICDTSSTTCDGSGDDQTIVEGQDPGTTVIGGVVQGNVFNSGSGKVTAGTEFLVEVRAVDSAFNTRTDHIGPVGITPAAAPDFDIISGPSNFTAGVATFRVRPRAVGTGLVITPTGTGLSEHASAPFEVEHNTATQLVAVLPGQSIIEGAASLAIAVDGNATDQTAGVAFNVEIYALDAYHNIVDNYNSGSANVSLNHNADPFAVSPAAQQITTGGKATFSITNYRADETDTHTVTPTCGSCTGSPTPRQSETYDVQGGAATQYAYVVPGYSINQGQAPTADDTDYNNFISGSADTQNTDTPFSVTVYALDDYFNVDPNYTGAVSIVTSDPNQDEDLPTGPTNFSAGTATFSVDAITAGTGRYITVTAGALVNANKVAAAPTDAAVMTYNVNPGASQKLVVIFPSYQTLQQGHNNSSDPDGGGPILGAISDETVQNRTAGAAQNVRVYLTDNEFNIVTTDNVTVGLSVSTPNSSVTPVNTSTLGDGMAEFNVSTYLVGAGYTLTPSGGGKSAVASTAYNIQTDTSTKHLIVRLPNQTFNPGKATLGEAITGTAFKQTQSSDFNYTVEVIATDKYYNQINVTDSVQLASNIAGQLVSVGALPQSKPLVAGAVDFDIYNTANSAGQFVTPSAATFTSNASSTYQVLEVLQNPTIALDDPTTSNTSYIRQSGAGAVDTTLTTPNTNTLWWCVSESQSTRPSSGTNNRGTCTGGGGTVGNGYWQATKPAQAAVSAGDASKTLYVWTSDEANNVSLTQVSDSITLDTVKPTTPSVTLSDNSGGPAVDPTAISDQALLTATITLPGDTDRYCIVETTSAGSANPSWNSCPTSDPVPGTTDGNNHGNGDGNKWRAVGTKPSTLQLNFTGNRKIHVFAMDAANNVSASAGTDTIIYDNTNPAFPGTTDIKGITGNQDNVQDNKLGTTGDPTVHFLEATDTDTSVSFDIAIRNAGDTADLCTAATGLTSGAICAGGNCAYTFSGCNLADATSAIVKITANDQAGHTANPDNNSFAFTVDRAAPAAFNITGLDGGVDSTVDNYLLDSLNNPNIHWQTTTGETEFKVSILNTAGTVTVCGEDTAAQDATNYQGFSGCNLDDSTIYRAKVVAYDDAGNSTAGEDGSSNTYYQFTTVQDIDHFDVELLNASDTPITDVTAGVAFKVRLTAKDGSNNPETAYEGNKTINWSTAAGNGVDTCGTTPGQTPVLASTTLSFTNGVGTTTASFTFKKVEGSLSITATEQNTGNNRTGSVTGFSTLIGALECVRIENAASGSTEMTTQNLASIDDTFTAHVASYDAYGNFIENPSGASWSTTVSSGTTAMNGLAVPVTGASTQVTGVRVGTGTLQVDHGGQSDTVNFVTPAGVDTWTAATTDDGSQTNNLLASSSLNTVFFWDVSGDVFNSWRTYSHRAWYTEAASSTRGDRDEFPTQAFLVGSDSALDIIDASTNELWMRFNSGSNYAVDSDLGTIDDVTALNGKIYLAMTSGVIVLDLANDYFYQMNNSTRLRAGSNATASRNGAMTWSSNTKFPLLSNASVYKLDSYDDGTYDYIGIGTGSAADVFRISSTATAGYTVAKYSDATSNAVEAVSFASNYFYYGEITTGLHRRAMPISANFTPANTYDYASTARLPALSIRDIDVLTGVGGSDYVSVATDRGLTVINSTSGTAKTYSALGTGNNPFGSVATFVGTDGYMSVPNAATSLTDTVTVDFWFRIPSANTNVVMVEKGDPTATDGAFSIGLDGSGNIYLTAYHDATAYTVTGGGATVDQWHHVVAMIGTNGGDNGRIELWVDGTSAGSNTTISFTAAFDVPADAMTIGGTASGGNFKGEIDEVRISNSNRYTFGSALTVPSSAFSADGNTVHLFHFAENSGTSADDAAQVANASLINDTVGFTIPTFTGANNIVRAIAAVKSGAAASCQILTSGTTGAHIELNNIQSTATETARTTTSLNADDIAVYHIDGTTDVDAAIARRTSGLRLDRK